MIIDADAYRTNFFMEHAREPRWIPSGDFYVDSNGDLRSKWTQNPDY